MGNLRAKTLSEVYRDMIQINNEGTGISGTETQMQDGNGGNIPIKMSYDTINIKGSANDKNLKVTDEDNNLRFAVDLDQTKELRLYNSDGDEVVQFDSTTKFATAYGATLNGYHGYQIAKILPSDFQPNDDNSTYNLAIENDSAGILGLRPISSTLELYASVDIPLGLRASDVMVYDQSDNRTVEVYEGSITDGSITSKGSGSCNTLINITDVTGTTTNFLWIKVTTTSSTDLVFGGYVQLKSV
ncbi:MAG: hypothetical protein Unbinned2514contig1001_36 [Prokaryotic dsDNA virus sp.]|nr:MAG: hypothetical protein Unbinned2514contig1001_36 [Prokaryotic dsDNA virus sp.]|tara:strand:- start:12994 stop:13725 length:732 start_codon:yes stop_codon:yes gene_type:complete